MKQSQPFLVMGNWKMNPSSLEDAKKIFLDIRKAIKRSDACEVVIAPPTVYLSTLHKLSPSGRIELASQDVSRFEKAGPHTGEVSLQMLLNAGTRHCIIGHSERRAMGETDADVAEKAAIVLKAKITAVVCVGEQERDTHGNYFTVVEQQVRSLLKVVKKNQVRNLVIAYEPIWAISKGDGKGKTATPEDAHEMRLFIEKIVADVLGRSATSKVRIIYGGSVNAKNVDSLLAESGMDGFLVGGASLRPSDFTYIIKASHKHGTHT